MSISYVAQTIHTESGEWLVQVYESGEILIFDAQGQLRGRFANPLVLGLHLAAVVAKYEIPEA